ncbi:MAG: VIT1/CCC1 transporter family protein [Jatrophihabitans sp.]
MSAPKPIPDRTSQLPSPPNPSDGTAGPSTAPHHRIGDPGNEVGHEHRDVSGGWLRPTVFGMVDGLVSNFALIAGVAAASDTAKPVVLAGIAGLVGGAISMGSGEYVSVRSQNESMQAEIEVERVELAHNAEAELDELTQIYINRGVDVDLARLVAEQLSADPLQALEIHAQEELGVDIHDLPDPRLAAVSSLLSFSVGALIPLLPFLFASHVLWLAAVLSLIGLFITGVLTARFTIRPWWYVGGRQVLFGLVSAAITYGVGHLVGANIS